jgi:hypothetical protein
VENEKQEKRPKWMRETALGMDRLAVESEVKKSEMSGAGHPSDQRRGIAHKKNSLQRKKPGPRAAQSCRVAPAIEDWRSAPRGARAALPLRQDGDEPRRTSGEQRTPRMAARSGRKSRPHASGRPDGEEKTQGRAQRSDRGGTEDQKALQNRRIPDPREEKREPGLGFALGSRSREIGNQEIKACAKPENYTPVKMIQESRKIRWTKACTLSFTVGWWKESDRVFEHVTMDMSTRDRSP